MASSNSPDFLKELPKAPGIYKMISGEGEIIYIGKARDLKKRVSSYFQKRFQDFKTEVWVGKVKKVEVVVTRNETEALLLEEKLIKSIRPKFNIAFRDDKSYPTIFLSADDPFPRIAYYRGKAKKTGFFFGPYPSAEVVKKTLDELIRVFQLRTCTNSFFKYRTRPCLQYQIKRCSAPCVGFVSVSAYKKDVRQAILFLNGRDKTLLRELKKNMEQASRKLQFEEASRLRDRLIRLQNFLESLRLQKEVPVEIEAKTPPSDLRLHALEEALQSSKPLQRIEGFDVSHTSGTSPVASCVVFKNGQAESSDYRCYPIKNIQKGDDYAALRQVLERRYQKKISPLPDLILVDGGLGQLHQAEEVLRKLEITEISLIAVAKGASRKPGNETVWMSGRKAPLPLEKDSRALHLIQNIRDEAHRFACSLHKRRRKKQAFHSVLEDIPQIGPKRRMLLLKAFGGLQGLTYASEEAISKFPGISVQLAKKIYRALLTNSS